MNAYALNVMDEGITCLREHLGVAKMEIFISTLQRNKDDYTKWHRHFVDTITDDEFDELCKISAERNPYAGNPNSVI